jgi:hypothetical protein
MKRWSTAERTVRFWRDDPRSRGWSTIQRMIHDPEDDPRSRGWSTIQRMIHDPEDDPRSRGWSTSRWRHWSTNKEMILALLRVWSTFEGIFHCIGNNDPLLREWSGPLRKWSTDPPMRCDQEHWGWPTVWDTHTFLRYGYCYGTLVRLYGVNSLRNTPCHALFCCFSDI